MQTLPLLAGLLVLTAACHGGDQWIAVVAPGLESAVQPLAAQRVAEGWQCTIITATSDPEQAKRQIAALAADGPSCCVLLVGDFGADGVPAGNGTRLRMTGEPTDLPWSRDVGAKRVATGRLPARGIEEARIMVRKVLDWPVQQRPQSPFPVVRLLGGHHAAPEAFSVLADNLTHTLCRRLIAVLPPEWQFEAAVHVEGSPWQVSDHDIASTAAGMMRSHATMFAYMGHSEPTAAQSKTTPLLSAKEWRSLPANGPRPGLFITCGCFACQIDPETESLGLAAIRAPGGPPAVIGSHGASAAAMGYLAISGFTASLARGPVRVGELWQAVLDGIATAPINPTEFLMLDMADGSQGKVPLDLQRAEHLEMWMLLGDPAMPLLPPPPEVAITVEPVEGSVIVSGRLPEAHAGAGLRITLERHPSALPAALPTVPPAGPERQGATRERRRLANEVVIASTEIKADGTSFSTSIPLPALSPAKPWTVRVVGASGTSGPPVTGVTQVR